MAVINDNDGGMRAKWLRSSREAWRSFNARLAETWKLPWRELLARVGGSLLPTGLYARALLIIITPIVLLESVVAFAFMERHWQSVTRRLSESTARDIAALIEVYES